MLLDSSNTRRWPCKNTHTKKAKFPNLCNSKLCPSDNTFVRSLPGLVNFVHAVAYYFYLNLPATFSQPGNDLIVKPCTESRMMVYSNLFKHDPGWARHSSYARAGRYFTQPHTNHLFRLCKYSFGAPSDGFLEVECVRAFCSRFVEIYFPSCAKRSIIDAFMPLLALHSHSLADVQ